MSSKRILIVDDEESILKLIKYNLEKAGFDTITASDGEKALAIASEEKLSLVILDLMLPGMDGIDVCKTLRQNKVKVPIIMVTAKDDEFDKVLGLELGADDYLTKPFSPRELLARVKAILRRVEDNQQDNNNDDNNETISIGELSINTATYEVVYNNETIELTPKEFELLRVLATNKGRVISRDQLLNTVWDYDFVGDTRIVDVHVSHLREKIEEDPKNPKYIKTVRGIGYKLDHKV
ncbi:response regulator transcription factor [Desulfuribacillus alkaliarsenatis]|uniref:DNA-binding response regulator n=1 Tax=Desulfuribacillus alkaliarsenatis TaxID=766136 RepID=A0A1E5FYE1_9FIRM|nr:response regulator transcription factor [Desulfuribacillus alkaliarsenatis]OEF95589.1 DNA-binding response regulator [Desulfuribacillus alkaliarsenatis]